MSIIIASAFIIGALVSNHVKYSSKIKEDFVAGRLMIFITHELIPQAFKGDSSYHSDLSVVMGFLI
jgi:zinc transporter ZupT